MAAVASIKCVICSKSLGKEDKQELTTDCGHIFHYACVQKRLDKKKKMDCKVCRKELALADALSKKTSTVFTEQDSDQPKAKECVPPLLKTIRNHGGSSTSLASTASARARKKSLWQRMWGRPTDPPSRKQYESCNESIDTDSSLPNSITGAEVHTEKEDPKTKVSHRNQLGGPSMRALSRKKVSIIGEEEQVAGTTPQAQTQQEIDDLTQKKPPICPGPNQISITIELSFAKKEFLQYFGRKILEQPGITTTSITDAGLHLSGNRSAVEKIKSDLDQMLHEKKIHINCSMVEHLELKCDGRMWNEFLEKYRVGASEEKLDRLLRYESNVKINISRAKNFDDRAQFFSEITLCSDSQDSLSKAITELQSYHLWTESWPLTEDEHAFIVEQQQRGKPRQSNNSNRDQCLQIKYYLVQLVRNPFIYIFVSYTRGMWYVKATGFKQHVQSSVSIIKSYLNDVVETEAQIPISGVMAFFLRTKASSDINKLQRKHNINITIFPPSRGKRNNDDNYDHNNDNNCLKLVGSISRVNLAQGEVQTYLEILSEQEKSFPCDTWDLSKNISESISSYLKIIQDSDDYKAIGLIKFYNLKIGKRETAPNVTFTVIGSNEETANDVIQQCIDIIEGYYIWKPSSNDYRSLSDILLIQEPPYIDQFRQEWNTKVQLERETNTVIIPARSKMIAEEIKLALQNLAVGKTTRMDRISVSIPIQQNIRRFVNQDIHSLIEEAKTQNIFIDSNNSHQLTITGPSEVITSIKDKINVIIEDIKQHIITNRLTLPFIESELIRANSYEIAKRIERETNTVIRDVQLDTYNSKLNVNDDINLTITCVVNSRGQSITVKKGDITKLKGVDAIVNAANGPLRHAGGLDKVISDAAGPALDQECKQLIVKNGGVAISTGQAVKTTAGYLPFKCVIHAIGPQYVNGNQQERPLLFSSILSSLRLAEQEECNSVALPAISAATYGFPMQDCVNIVIRAVKQFFADCPQSRVRNVVLIDIDDSAYNAFAREVVNDHTKTVADDNDDIMNYQLPPLTSKWCWKDDKEEKIYDDGQTYQIEAAFQQFLQTSIPSTLKINCDNLKSATIVCYSIHFLPEIKQILTDNPNALNDRIVCGYQMRENTRYKRNIIRYPLVPQTHYKSVEYHPKPLDTYHLQVETNEDDWDIISRTSAAVKQAEIEIRKAITSATVSELFSVNLSEDIDKHKKVINNIAIQEYIQVDFQPNHKEKLSLILKGFQQNVLQAKLKIALYVHDILKMEVHKDDALAIPKEWDEQEEQCKLIELPKTHSDFIRIENRMKETINNVKIEKIERVQNLRLWNFYAFRRRTLQQELNNTSNFQIEMELFHGTGKTLPSEIYNGEYGFDMTFSTKGLWGIGTYFAANASYSCRSYSYQLLDGKRQVFLAQVLTGEIYDCKTKSDSTLRRPPKKNESESCARYNSVAGETGGSKVYIVYENRVAYPAFLITFSQ